MLYRFRFSCFGNAPEICVVNDEEEQTTAVMPHSSIHLTFVVKKRKISEKSVMFLYP